MLIAATGGTARHSLALEHALRPLFTYLRAVVVPTAVYAAPEDWGLAGAQLSRAGIAAGPRGELADLGSSERSRRRYDRPAATSAIVTEVQPVRQLLGRAAR